MGFFYSDKNGNRVFGYKLTIKFGGDNHKKEDTVNSFAEKVVTVLEKLGVHFETEADNDPNKDKRLL